MSARHDFAADEMFDGEEDLAAPGRLGEFLRYCEGRILRPYEDADRRALHNQWAYRFVILAAAVLTTATLVVTTLNTVFSEASARTTAFLWTELAFALASAAIVAVGLKGRWQKKWLLDRYRAERYRLAKFELVTSAEFWARGSEDWRPQLDSLIDGIAGLDDDSLDDEARQERIARLPSLADSAAVPADDLGRVLAYYKRRRLAVQINYFARVARRKRSVWLLSFWLPAVFFTSMICVAGHLVLELLVRSRASSPSEAREAISRALLFLSLMLPLLFAGMRLRHTANEVARNQNRSIARREGLLEIARRIGGVPEDLLVQITETLRQPSPGTLVLSTRVAGPPDAAFVFSHLALAEQILEADQREWLRLMLDAEWFR